MGIFDAIGNVIGTIVGANSDRKRAHENQDLQKEFAQNGIRWKVADAEAAGIHPLAALGTQTTAYQPAFDDSSIPAFSAMGQNIGRAIDATRTGEERYDARVKSLALERGELENDLLRSQIVQLNRSSGAVPPPLPSIGGDNTYSPDHPVRVEPARQTAQEPGYKGKDAGAYNSYTYEQLSDGAVAIRPTPEAKNAMDDSVVTSAQWHFNNQFLPENMGGAKKPPKKYWPKGAVDMKWSALRGAFVPVFPKGANSRKKYNILTDELKSPGFPGVKK